MASNYEDCYLVVYGTKLKPYFGRGRKTGRQEAAIQIARMQAVIRGWKAEFYLRFPNIKYMELPTKDAFIEYIVTNYRQAVIAEATRGVSNENRKAIKADDDPRVKVLSALPGITDAIAKDILNKYGGLKPLMRAKTTQKDLMSIKGMTRRKARAVLELRRPYRSDS
jgi:ERCC4-type nuclease